MIFGLLQIRYRHVSKKKKVVAEPPIILCEVFRAFPGK